MQAELQIFLLGRLRVVVKGFVVPHKNWQKRKAKLLFEILALHPLNELHREELIEKLFPDSDEKSANAGFYRILYAARKALEPERSSYASSNYLLSEGQLIKLTASGGLWIDAKEFEQKAREGLKRNDRYLLETAAKLYQGDLLADEPFEEWIINRREGLKRLFHSVLRRLAESAEKQGDTEEAHFWLDRILQHEPVDEDAHCAKMQLYLKQGKRSLALLQYEKCREILKRELSVEPDEEIERLREEILTKK